ncbi:MAG: hypothetical protein WC505_07975 [Patescibacteria group bacterium]
MSPQQYGLLMTGLGMMQNNRGKSLGESLAAGGMQGVGGMMDMQQANQMQQLKDLQMQQAQTAMDRQRKQDSREDSFRSAMQGIDPADNGALSKALFDAGLYEDAIKLKKGNGFGGGDYQFISGPNGKVIVGDKNAGTMKYGDIDGNPAVMGVYDPATQQRIADVKAGAKIDQVPMSDGSTLTTRMRNVPTVTMSPDQESAEIARLNATDPNAMSRADYQAQIGVSQTPGAKKAQEESAKNQADIAAESAKKQVSASRMLQLLESPYEGKTIDTLIKESTGSGLGSLRDSLSGAVGVSTEGSKALASLRTLQGHLTSNVPRMQGPQSDKDVEMYKEMAGKIADPFTPADVKLKSYNTIKEIMQRQSGYENPSASQLSAPASGGFKVTRVK